MPADPIPTAPSPPAAVPAPPRRPSRGLRLVRALAALAVLVALGALAWLYWQQYSARIEEQDATIARLSQEVRALTAEAERLDGRQADVSAIGQRNAAQIAAFAQRIDQHEQTMGRLAEDLAGGAPRLQLAGVEQLLLLANDRVQLARDVASAAVALEAADARLARLADPRLFEVRKAIADERAALAAVPVPDRATAALTLSALIARAARLPLAARTPDHYEAPPAPTVEAGAGSLGERLAEAVRTALRAMFTVRRTDGPAPRLLSVEAEARVAQVLELKLEGARAAWLLGDTVSFRDLVDSSGAWLREHFRGDDPGVQAALAELERLRPLELQPALPDISRSLVLLRAQLDAKTQ